MNMNHRSFNTLLGGLLLACLILSQPMRADEGMWTFDNFPAKAVGTKYGFTPSQAWLDHVRASSLRIAGGCSASFISPQGLVMTNHHCVVDCVQALSTPQQNLVESGFAAQTAAEERQCHTLELDQLVQIRDVTAEVQQALAGKTGDAANAALHAKEAESSKHSWTQNFSPSRCGKKSSFVRKLRPTQSWAQPARHGMKWHRSKACGRSFTLDARRQSTPFSDPGCWVTRST